MSMKRMAARVVRRDLRVRPGIPPAGEPRSSPTLPAKGTQNGHEDPLKVVVEWARAHRTALQSSTSQEHGQWEAVVQGESVLLIRQPYLNRMLMQQKFDLRTIMMAWRDTGVIMAEEKRFTVHTRAQQEFRNKPRPLGAWGSWKPKFGLRAGAPSYERRYVVAGAVIFAGQRGMGDAGGSTSQTLTGQRRAASAATRKCRR